MIEISVKISDFVRLFSKIIGRDELGVNESGEAIFAYEVPTIALGSVIVHGGNHSWKFQHRWLHASKR